MEENTKKMMERIHIGEMKMVEVTITLIVPAYVTHKMIEENVKEGVAFQIEEHIFFTDDELTVAEDDVTLLEITVSDVKLEEEKDVFRKDK